VIPQEIGRAKEWRCWI